MDEGHDGTTIVKFTGVEGLAGEVTELGPLTNESMEALATLLNVVCFLGVVLFGVAACFLVESSCSHSVSMFCSWN